MLAESIALILLIFALIILIAAWFIAQSRRKKEEAQSTYIDGLLAIVEGDRKRAIKLLRQTALSDSSNIQAFILLGDLLREGGTVKRGIDVHRRLLMRTGLHPALKLRILKSLVLDYYELDDYEMVIDLAKQGLDIAKQDVLLLDMLVTSYEKTEQWSKAARASERLDSVTGGDNKKKRALYKLEEGKNLLQLDEIESAREKFKEALKIDENCLYAYIVTGDSFKKEAKWDKAIKWYKDFMLHFPQSAHLVLDRIESVFYEKGEFSKTIEVYTSLLKEHPEHIYLAGALAELYAKMGEHNKATEILEKRYKILNTQQKLSLIHYYYKTDKVEKFARVIEELVKESERKRKFVCKVCGYQSDEILWHCPRCSSWDSFNLEL